MCSGTKAVTASLAILLAATPNVSPSRSSFVATRYGPCLSVGEFCRRNGFLSAARSAARYRPLEPLAPELGSRGSVLLHHVVDDVLLSATQPAGNYVYEEGECSIQTIHSRARPNPGHGRRKRCEVGRINAQCGRQGCELANRSGERSLSYLPLPGQRTYYRVADLLGGGTAEDEVAPWCSS